MGMTMVKRMQEKDRSPVRSGVSPAALPVSHTPYTPAGDLKVDPREGRYRVSGSTQLFGLVIKPAAFSLSEFEECGGANWASS